MRQKKRDASELEHPELPVSHWKNKKQPILQVRIEKDLLSEFERWVSARGLSKKRGIEVALKSVLKYEI